MAFFSIIIPTYNRAHTIRRPIDSMLAQTFKDWELIIVDDGSTDGTKEIIKSYDDQRIRYVWQENQERSAARNHGIELAKGEWICFQDSDDEYLGEHLQVLYQGIGASPEFKIFRTGLLIYANGKYIGKSGVHPIRYDSFPYECVHVTVFSKQILRVIRFDCKYYISEDLHFLLQCGMQFAFKFLEKWTAIHHYDPESSGGVGPNYYKNLLNQKTCLDDILTWNKTLIIPYIVRKRCLNEILMLYGHFKYKKELIFKAILDNVSVFIRFPLEYTKLITRILYVKIGEFSGLYRTQGRF